MSHTLDEGCWGGPDIPPLVLMCRRCILNILEHEPDEGRNPEYMMYTLIGIQLDQGESR